MNKRKVSIAVWNHGCKLNQFEGESLESELKSAGFTLTDPKSASVPDVSIINTCTVTGKSDRKSRASIYRAVATKKRGGLVVVTGCYASTDTGLLSRIEGVDFVLGNSEKASIPTLIEAVLSGHTYSTESVDRTFQFKGPEHPHRSRAFVKVQDGCSMSCAYCKVPLARGASRSRPAEDIITYVKEVVDRGYREIVLTGINLGDYRFNGERLSHLLRKLLKTDSTFRVRLSSIEPFCFTRDMLDTIEDPRIVGHFHIPLQSGSDRILALMGRPYRAREFLELIKRIRSIRPESHLATDVIVGFPSERHEDFKRTFELVKETAFASLHVFKYSSRPGTRASHMADDVPFSEKSARSNALIKLGQKLNEEFRKRFVGTVRETVIESRQKATKKENIISAGTGCPTCSAHSIPETERSEWCEGITDNYIRVRMPACTHALFPNDRGLNRKILPVEITRVTREFTVGKLVNERPETR